MNTLAKYFLAVFAFSLMAVMFLQPPSKAFAASTPVICPTGQTNLANTQTCCPTGHNKDAQDCFVAKYVNPAIKMFSMIAGVAIIAGVIMGDTVFGIGWRPQKAAAAKVRLPKRS